MIPPGLHPGVPLSEYLSLDAASSSRLRDLGRSAAYCREMIDHPKPSTAANIFGSLVDAMLLEPETVPHSFLRSGTCEAHTKAGNVCGNNASLIHDGSWYCGVKSHAPDGAAPPSLPVLPDADWDRAQRCVEKIRAHPWFASLLEIQPQLTVVWQDWAGPMSLACKGRPDFLALRQDGTRVLVDLKACRQAAQGTYERQAVRLWHPQQLAWYDRGLREAGEEIDERWVLAVHPEAPHEVTAYRMTPVLNEWCDRLVEARLQTYGDCLRSGQWPDGVASEVDVWLPDYIDDTPAIDDETVVIEED